MRTLIFLAIFSLSISCGYSSTAELFIDGACSNFHVVEIKRRFNLPDDVVKTAAKRVAGLWAAEGRTYSADELARFTGYLLADQGPYIREVLNTGLEGVLARAVPIYGEQAVRKAREKIASTRTPLLFEPMIEPGSGGYSIWGRNVRLNLLTLTITWNVLLPAIMHELSHAENYPKIKLIVGQKADLEEFIRLNLPALIEDEALATATGLSLILPAYRSGKLLISELSDLAFEINKNYPHVESVEELKAIVSELIWNSKSNSRFPAFEYYFTESATTLALIYRRATNSAKDVGLTESEAVRLLNGATLDQVFRAINSQK